MKEEGEDEEKAEKVFSMFSCLFQMIHQFDEESGDLTKFLLFSYFFPAFPMLVLLMLHSFQDSEYQKEEFGESLSTCSDVEWNRADPAYAPELINVKKKPVRLQFLSFLHPFFLWKK